jgi:hypothetical protein
MSIFLKAGLWVSKKTGYKGELNLSELFSGGGNNSYSQTETFTGGTWIDGKPIYRKVLPFTVPGLLDPPTGLLITHNLNIDKYIKLQVVTDRSVNLIGTEDQLWTFPLITAISQTSLQVGVVQADINGIRFEEIKSTITTNDFLLILEYTKI